MRIPSLCARRHPVGVAIVVDVESTYEQAKKERSVGMWR